MPRSNKAMKRISTPPLHQPETKRGVAKAPTDSLARLLDEWLADESGYDEETWPGLKEAIERNRLSRRKRFRD